MRTLFTLVCCLATLGLTGEAFAQSRASQNPAKIITATQLGSSGNEFFTAAGVLSNGDILVCGVGFDTDLKLLGKQAQVIGKDGKAGKPIKEWVRLGGEETGVLRGDAPMFEKPKTERDPLDPFGGLEPPKTKKQLEKERKAKQARLRSVPRKFKWSQLEEKGSKEVFYSKLHWFQDGATGFIAIFSPDMKTLKALHRLPRGAGSIADAVVADDGSVYISGAASKDIANFAKPIRTEKVPDPPGVHKNTFGPRRMYLAKLAPDAASVQWLIDIHGWSIAPSLTAMNNGNITLHGPGLRTYTSEGKLVRSHSVRNTRVLSGLAVDPSDGDWTRVGDWMSPTGREPYRTPRLVIYDKDGEVKKDLMSWRGPFAGIDAHRLVADSAVRRSQYDAEGNLYYTTWSHGGNNVMFRYPYDIERFMPDALRFTTSETVSVVVKLDPDHNVIRSIRRNYSTKDLAVAADGSVLWQQGDRMMIADPNLGAMRFEGEFPDVGGRIVVGGCAEMTNGWNFATGVSKGRTLLIGVSGTEGGKIRTHDPLQKGFAGGLVDGYLVVWDLTATKPFVAYQHPQNKREPKVYEGDLAWPENGQKWRTGYEDYMNAKVVFRDAGNDMWPSFFGGGTGLGGSFTYGEDKSTASLAIECPHPMLQMGDQSQKVLGQLMKYEKQKVKDKKGRTVERDVFINPVSVRIGSSEPWKRLPRTKVRRVGGVYCPQAETTMSGSLSIGAKTVKFDNARCVGTFKIPKSADPETTLPNHALLRITFDVKGSQIGLTGDLADETIHVSAQFSAVSGEVGERVGGW